MSINEANPVPRILVIDDNQAIHEDFAKILTCSKPKDDTLDELETALFGSGNKNFVAPNYALDFAAQGQEALAMVKQAEAEGNPYSLAFVDGRMPPGWDGIETIRRLWKESPELQMVLCTAYADYSWEEIQQELGETDSLVILKKPFDIAEVLQLTYALTRKWELNREIQGRLHKLAYFDSLTGLPNRTQFLSYLKKSLDIAKKKQKMAALLYIDLDDFKRINDTLGHSIGDKLLEIIAQRLAGSVRDSDLIGSGAENHQTARLGGDEFTVLLSDIESEAVAESVAKRISNDLSHPVDLGSHQVMISPSIGIALSPSDGDNADTLMKNADLAMYFAKRKGPENYRFYQESMNSDALKNLTIETQLRYGLEKEEFSLVYQPQFDLNTGEMSGFEALLRWQNPELGVVPPMEFIPIAEESGLIYPIGEWVMRTACRQTKEWHDQGIVLPRIGVNASPKEFSHPDFLNRVKSILEETDLKPTFLQIEITETLLMENYEQTSKTLEELHQMGVQVAIDDFGKGYSSLNRLQSLSIDSLKIDRSFVRGINTGFKEESVLNAIIVMATGLNLGVIAEGVETQSQYHFLKAKLCNEAQGYMLSMPLTTDEAENFLKNKKCFSIDSEATFSTGAVAPGIPNA